MGGGEEEDEAALDGQGGGGGEWGQQDEGVAGGWCGGWGLICSCLLTFDNQHHILYKDSRQDCFESNPTTINLKPEQLLIGL